MKKLFTIFATALFMLSMFAPIALSVKAAPEVLRIYNWEDYIGIDDDGVELWDKAFSNYYQDRNPGKTVKVEYSKFGTNEDLYNQMLINKKGYDLVCPSDYMIEKMIDKDMLEKLEPDRLESYYDNVSPYIKNLFETNGVMVGDELKALSDYAVGYMWGTMGYVYNPEIVAKSDVENWSAIWNIEYKNKSTLKNSIRDTYFLALGYVYRDELNLAAQEFENTNNLEKYSQTLSEIFNRTEDDDIEKVKNALLIVRKNIFSFELDEGKNDMATGKIALNFAWSGDAVAAMDSAEESGTLLHYSVPKQGSNVWFDGWVMPKGANKDLAYEFLNFLSQPEIAIKNMDEIGYTSVIAGDEVLDRVNELYGVAGGEFTADLSYFFGKTAKIKTDTNSRQLFAQYPDKEIIDRCTVMQNFSDERLLAITKMWDSVKSNPLSPLAIILIVVGALLIIGGISLYVTLKKRGFKPKKKMVVVKKG